MNTELKQALEAVKAYIEETEAEKAQGWHFCADWDGLLVGPGMAETDGCSC